MNTKLVAKKLLDAKQQDAFNALTSVASKVRFLATITTSRGDISRFLTESEGRLVRYQWVRNVLETPLKKG